jgi:hypothetical protein
VQWVVTALMQPFCLFVIMKCTDDRHIILNPFDFEESSVFDVLICKFLVLLLRSGRILIYYDISQKLLATIQEIVYLGKVV